MTTLAAGPYFRLWHDYHKNDRPSVSYADDNSQHVIEGDELLSLEIANRRATLGARHGNDFINHDLRFLLEPILLAWLDRQAKERCFNKHACDKAYKYAVHGLKLVGLNNDSWARFSVISGR